MSQDAVASTITALYEAALDPRSWPHALDRLRVLFDGAAAVTFLHDLETGEVPLWLGVGTSKEGEQEYIEHVKDVNPRARFSLARPPSEIAWDYLVLPEEAMRRHPFYDWLQRSEGLRYFVGSRLFVDGSRSAFTSIERTARQGHVQQSTLVLYRRVLPHISQAMRLTISRTETELQAATFDAILNGFACGIVVLDARRRPLFVNAQAQLVLTRDDGLRLVQGEVQTAKAADTRRLHGLIDEAIATGAGADLHPAAAMPVARRGHAIPYLVTVVPLAIEPLPGMVERPAAAVVIREIQIDVGPPADELERTFGLSRREAALAAAFGRGLSLPEAARTLGISHNTARVHLQGIFVKTGARSQLDLARLLMRLSPLRGPPAGAVPRPQLREQ